MTSNENVELNDGLQTAIDLYRSDQLDSAIAATTKLGKRFPDSSKLWGYLGFLHREANDLPAAVRSFRRVVALSPKSERASLGLFFALWHLQKYGDALKEIGRFSLAGKPREYISLLSGLSDPEAPARNRPLAAANR